MGLLPSPWGHALAHGEALEIFRGREGPFEIVVSVQPNPPLVGTLHFSVTPINPESGTLLLNTEITIIANDPEGKPAYQVRAVNSPLSVELYDANMTVETPGDWTISVEVSREAQGTATFNFPLHIGEQALPPANIGTLVWLTVLVVLAGGATYVWYRSRQALQQT